MNVFNLLYRLFLTFNATSLILVVYLVKKRIFINFSGYSHFVSSLASCILYCLVPLVLTYLSVLLSKELDDDSIESVNGESVINVVELANNAYLPSYLGYFFVALSIENCNTMIFVFFIIFLFTYLSQSLYFNPILLVLGYHFYYLTTITNIRIFIISRRNFKNPKTLYFLHLKRINNFTFIDKDN